MNENTELALNLMAIGMFTVFAILFMVVTGGNLLIKWVNRFIPEVIKQEVVKPDQKKLAAIIAAVQVITKGKGNIEKITKIN